jgi:hypothetical protein
VARTPCRFKEYQLRGIVALVFVALVASFVPPLAAAKPAGASAAPKVIAPIVVRSESASLTVTLSKPAPAITPTGTVQVTVGGSLAVRADTLSVRLRFRRPNGRLIWQKTVERYSVKPGPLDIGFSRSLSDMALKEGRYTIEVYVTADSLPPVTLSDRLYLIRAGRPAVPLVVVTRFNYSPMIDPEGRFVLDPASTTQTRDEVLALSALMSRSSSLRLTLGVPPLLLEEWRRVTSGYRTVAPEGVRSVGKDAPIASTYASAIAALKRTVADPRVELLDVPFADPDLAGLRSIGAMDDLRRQYDRGTSVYQATLGTKASAGTAVLGDSVPAAALPSLTAEHITHVLLKPTALAASDTATQVPDVFGIAGSPVRGLVIDERASALLGDRTTKPEDLLDHLFTRLTSPAGGRPLTVTVNLGPGARTDVASLDAMLRELGRSGWVRFETAEQAAKVKPAGTARLRPIAYPGRPAPYGYWAEVGQARRYANAYIQAVSERDDDASAALYDSLVAESRCWAGPDNSWIFADRGRTFAESAFRSSQRVLETVSVATQTITLSGSTGKVPISIKNSSGKTLNVFIVATSAHTRFPSGSRIKATLRPADNYVTVPVDMGAGGIYDTLRLSVVSGTVTLASTTVDVRASYLDRLALVAMVVLVLVGLLFYIRRKVRAAEADT